MSRLCGRPEGRDRMTTEGGSMHRDPVARLRAAVAALRYLPDATMHTTATHLHLSRPRIDVETGGLRRLYWAKPWPADIVALAGDPDVPDERLALAVARFVWREWVLEAAHEVAEWLRPAGGGHVVDPHPGGQLVAGDGVGEVRVRIEFPDGVRL